MADLATLKAEIHAREQKGDLRGIVKLRAELARDFPGTPEAAEALFRLGLYFLFVEGQIPAAIQTLEETIKTKDPQWSKAARVSLASLYLREQKPQKALLELRKAVGDKEPPSIHSYSALSIIEAIHDQAGNAAEALKAKQEKIKHLRAMIDDATAKHDDAAAGYFLMCLALDLHTLEGDAASREVLNQIITMGPTRVGAKVFEQAQNTLKLLR